MHNVSEVLTLLQAAGHKFSINSTAQLREVCMQYIIFSDKFGA